jgi:hypothetical protein
MYVCCGEMRFLVKIIEFFLITDALPVVSIEKLTSVAFVSKAGKLPNSTS